MVLKSKQRDRALSVDVFFFREEVYFYSYALTKKKGGQFYDVNILLLIRLHTI